MKYRRFIQDFKRSVIQQLLSETATPLELCTRYNISSGQLYTWKRQCAQGKLDPEPSREVELASRVRELERVVGKLTLESEFLKKPYETASNKQRKETLHCRESHPCQKRSKGVRADVTPKKNLLLCAKT